MTTVRKQRNDDAIRETVQRAYASRAEGGGCCGSVTSNHRDSALRIGYSAREVESVPVGANLGLGCGAPLQAAKVGAGETVLDLGSGAGFDTFLAAKAVGAEGRVIGIDMTPEMVEVARQNASRAGLSNVEFRQGLIEELPVADESVDAVISNCVINLSPDKAAVFREAFRVLRPGGRMVVSDIVLTAALPEFVADSIAAYVGCVAGASLLDDYLGFMRDAGFEEIEVLESRPAVESLAEDDPIVRAVLDGAGVCCLEDLASDVQRVASQVLSAKIIAHRP